MSVNINLTSDSGIGMTSLRTRDRLISQLRKAGIKNTAVLNAIMDVPRHYFVDEAFASRAYEDTALPIGHNQTISRPYSVAKMTEYLLLAPSMEKVLEIGTGSGYQTAILSNFATTIYSIERIEPLLKKAIQRFTKLGINNVYYGHGDGKLGWQEHAPFDVILVAAAHADIPTPLVNQLKIGGWLIMPIGYDDQELVVIKRNTAGYSQERLEGAKFVPMLGGSY